MKKGIFVFVAIILLEACGDGNVRIEVDPAIQREADSISIAEYLSMNGFSEDQIGTTTNGVRFVVIDSGSRNTNDIIDESDQLYFDYIGHTLGDTIFDTSIESVGDSLEAHYQANPFVLDGDTISVFTNLRYNQLFITYSSAGWTIPTGQGGFIFGFAEGMASVFKDMGVGGKGMIFIPSGLAYGQGGSGVFIQPNSPIAFELFPDSLIKQ